MAHASLGLDFFKDWQDDLVFLRQLCIALLSVGHRNPGARSGLPFPEGPVTVLCNQIKVNSHKLNHSELDLYR